MSARANQQVLARLGDHPITAADVDFHLNRTAEQAKPEMTRLARENTIQWIALQRQALQTLRKLNLAVSRDEVDRWIEQQPLDRESQGVRDVVDSMVQRWGIREETYRDHVAFRLSWQRYLAEHLNEGNLTKHFQNQRERFDGTTFEYSMVSIPVPAGQSEARNEAARQLEDLITLVSNRRDSSQLLNAGRDRNLEVTGPRWVPGFGEVDNRVVDTLRTLADGEISKPFDTAGGVHVIQRLQTKAGNLEIDEVRGEVRAHMLVYLIVHLASQSERELPLITAEH